MNKRKLKNDNCRGVIMIESMVVVIITIIVLVILLSIGFLMYEQFALTVIAEDTAAKIAEVYVNGVLDDFQTGKLCINTSYQSMFSFGNRTIDSSHKSALLVQYAQAYVSDRMKRVAVSNSSGIPHTSVGVFSDGIGRSHVLVEIALEYDVPLGDFLFFLNMDKKQVFSATGTAECFDITEYYNGTKFARNVCTYLDGKSTILKTINGFIKMFHSY